MNLNEIISTDAKYYMNTFGARTPVCFTHGEGALLYDQDGKEYIDMLAGIAVTALGHNHAGVVNAISHQAARLIHVSNIVYNEPQTQLAQALIDGAGAKNGLTRVFFSNSGAEANEGAIKLAKKYFYAKGDERCEIISAGNSFHGRTLATVAATGQPKYQKPYKQLLPHGIVNVPYNDIAAMESAITGRTAAVLLETIQCEGGVIMGGARYLQAVQELCTKNGILFIIDEVQTGCGRTSTLFNFEQYGLLPDIVTLAKALGNGVPIGAFLAKESVANAFMPGDHGSTFGGNPLCCAAGNVVISELLKPGFLDSVKEKGEDFRAELKCVMAKHPSIIDVRGAGLMTGVELNSNISGAIVVGRLLKRGIHANCAGHNTLRLVPPLIISIEMLHKFCIELDAVLNEMEEK